MSVTATVQNASSLGGKSFNATKTLTAEAAFVGEESIPAAQPGVLTTRDSGGTSGEITADNSGHGITTGQRVDLYWTEGGVKGQRRGVAVGTVAGAAIPISGGVGDSLPSQDNAIDIGIVTSFDVVVEGDNVKAIFAFIGGEGLFVLEDAGGEELGELLGAGQSYKWWEDKGPDNPIAGDSIIKGYLSHSDTASAQTGRIGVLFNNA